MVLYPPRAHVHMLIPLGFFIMTVTDFLMLRCWLLVELVGGVGALRVEGGGVAVFLNYMSVSFTLGRFGD